MWGKGIKKGGGGGGQGCGGGKGELRKLKMYTSEIGKLCVTCYDNHAR